MLHAGLALRALLVASVLILWAYYSYSLWFFLAALVLIFFFTDLEGVLNRHLSVSLCVAFFSTVVLIRSLHPFSYGLPSALLLAVLLSVALYLAFGLIASDFSLEEKARKLYYLLVSLLLFMAVILAAPYHQYASMLSFVIGTYLLLNEEFAWQGLTGPGRTFVITVLTLVSFELLSVTRFLPLNFYNLGIFLALLLYLGKDAILTNQQGSITAIYILRQITAASLLILFIFLVTDWSIK